MMPERNKKTEYIIRFFFLLLSIASVVAALLVVGNGIGVVVLMILAFFSLLISASYQGTSVELGDYKLDFGDELPDGYNGLIEHASKSSKVTAQRLREVRRHADSGDPFHDLSVIIDSGMNNRNKTAADQLLSALKINISARRYSEKFSDTEMKVVRFQNNKLYVNSSGKSEYLKEGMKFRIYRNTCQISD